MKLKHILVTDHNELKSDVMRHNQLIVQGYYLFISIITGLFQFTKQGTYLRAILYMCGCFQKKCHILELNNFTSNRKSMI